MVTIYADSKICNHCNNNQATVPIRGSFVYCDGCWQDINQRKSDKMLSLNIKRSKETRAAMSASKRANKNLEPDKWLLFHDFYLEQLSLQEKYRERGA